MATLAKLKAEVAELRKLAAAKQRADIYVPRADWPDWLRYQRDKWDARIIDAESPYEFLLDHLAEIPAVPLKDEYRAKASCVDGVVELYRLLREA